MGRPRLSLAAYLEGRRRAHDALTDFQRRSVVRYTARKRCELEGASVPEWAQEREAPPPPPRPRKHQRPVFPRTGPEPTHRAGPATPAQVPEELRAWRSRGEGRVVQLSGAAVVLHELCARPRKFPSVEAAIAAVA